MQKKPIDMNNKDHIVKMVESALESMEGAGKAMPRPYLFTRIKARIERNREVSVERSGSFITRPAFVIAGLSLVIGINVFVIAINNINSNKESFVVNETGVSADEFGTSVATLYDIENNESQ